MKAGYPVVLDVADKRCLVIGTGGECGQRAESLIQAGARGTRLDDYHPGCLKGFFLAISAGTDRSRNAEIFAEAERENVLANCVDDPPNCRFIFPSVHRQGDLTISVSTAGVCPALAVRLREMFESRVGPEYAEFLEMADGWRAILSRANLTFEQRRRVWYALVDSEILELLRQGKREEASGVAASLLPAEAVR